MTVTGHVSSRAGLRDPRASGVGQHGEVFTRQWVVDLILDLCRYSPDSDLTTWVLLEPAVGEGAFLMPALERLLAAKSKHAPDLPWDELSGAVIAMDLQQGHVVTCRTLVVQLLQREGCPSEIAVSLAQAWIKQADFLLADMAGLKADVIVGNPPYIRIEDIDAHLLRMYRRACPTMGGRADIYVGFYERALNLLKAEGRLGFICADRWMRNQYGRGLRSKIVGGGFAMDACLVMHDTPVFETQVSAYPAITVLRRGEQGCVATGDATGLFDRHAAERFASWASTSTAGIIDEPSTQASWLPRWHSSSDSWPDGSPATLTWLEELADRFPLLEDKETGTRIGIGVATGADAVYVTRDAGAVEPERMLPLAMSADVKSGQYEWTGHYLVNPWDENGLVDLDDWPELRAYLTRHSGAVRGRAIARKNTGSWHRTIDRVTMSLARRPKLLLEDMKARPNPVLEPGSYYPHHNLYYLISDTWDLEVLGGLLLSDVMERQISAYCVKMRGKTLRFQAQYLRRVRVPRPDALSSEVRQGLAAAFRARDRAAATQAALGAFSIDTLPR
ncbi:Eco57I restriction-modification methylase domain-containing protein [Micromonospora parva]|uniref:Eco57I restriction-modification methylase domain-containing protein n=1 Tax=Micromonospora parva TaxID=1464048 RepID=UPI0034118B18